jgi:hypothetical protein
LRILPALGLVILLGGCSSERQFAYDSVWPFGDPNAPVAASETAQRALGHKVAMTPLAPQAGNVWPGPVTPVPTLSQEQQNMTQPLGQAYTPSLPSPYPPGTEPPASADLGIGPLTSSPNSDGLMAPNVSAPPSASGLGAGIQPPLAPPEMPGTMGGGTAGGAPASGSVSQ